MLQYTSMTILLFFTMLYWGNLLQTKAKEECVADDESQK